MPETPELSDHSPVVRSGAFDPSSERGEPRAPRFSELAASAARQEGFARNALNTEEVEAFLSALADDKLAGADADREQKARQWLLTVARKHLIREGASAPAAQSETALPAWAQAAIGRGEPVIRIDCEAERGALEDIADWLRAPNGPALSGDWSRISVPQAIRAEKEWIEAMARAAERRMAEQKDAAADEAGTEEALRLSDGWRWVKVISPESLDREGALMRHCVGSYADRVAEGRVEIWSLRDSENKPHATIESRGNSFCQLKGFANSAVSDALCVERVCAFLTDRKAKSEQSVKLDGADWEKAGIQSTMVFGGRFMTPHSVLSEAEGRLALRALREDEQALSDCGMAGLSPGFSRRVRAESRAIENEGRALLADPELRGEEGHQRIKAHEARAQEHQKKWREISGSGLDGASAAMLIGAALRSSAEWATPQEAAQMVECVGFWRDQFNALRQGAPSQPFSDLIARMAQFDEARAAQTALETIKTLPWGELLAVFGGVGGQDEQSLRAAFANRAVEILGSKGPQAQAAAKELFVQSAEWSEAIAAKMSYNDATIENQSLPRSQFCAWSAALRAGRIDWVQERMDNGGKALGYSATVEALRAGSTVEFAQAVLKPWAARADDQVWNHPYRDMIKECAQWCAQAAQEGQLIAPQLRWISLGLVSEELKRCESHSDLFFVAAKAQARELFADWAFERISKPFWPERQAEHALLVAEAREAEAALRDLSDATPEPSAQLAGELDAKSWKRRQAERQEDSRAPERANEPRRQLA